MTECGITHSLLPVPTGDLMWFSPYSNEVSCLIIRKRTCDAGTSQESRVLMHTISHTEHSQRLLNTRDQQPTPDWLLDTGPHLLLPAAHSGRASRQFLPRAGHLPPTSPRCRGCPASWALHGLAGEPPWWGIFISLKPRKLSWDCSSPTHSLAACLPHAPPTQNCPPTPSLHAIG